MLNNIHVFRQKERQTDRMEGKVKDIPAHYLHDHNMYNITGLEIIINVHITKTLQHHKRFYSKLLLAQNLPWTSQC